MPRNEELEFLAGFGRRLRSLRNLLGLSREKFALIVGMEAHQLSEFENGACQPSFRILRRISDVTTCDLDFLITGAVFGSNKGRVGVSKEWEVLFGKLIAGNEVVSSAWYWESDENHRLTLTCKPPKGPHSSAGIIGRTRWENVDADIRTNEHWARHYRDLEARAPINNFIFRGNKGFVKVWGRPSYDSKGKFVGYRGYAGPATMEEAMAQWRADQSTYAATG